MILTQGSYVGRLIVEKYTPDRAVEATLFLYDLF